MGDELRGENLVHLNVRFSTETELKKIQDFLYEKSGQGVSFTGLVEAMANEVTIVTAVHNIKSNKGSKTAGVDKIKMDKYLQMPKDELILLIQSSFRNYRPKPARREYIEKSNGKKRPLGIPTVLDRIIQECVRIIIEPICEARFYPQSYGFRPYRAQKHAIRGIINVINAGCAGCANSVRQLCHYGYGTVLADIHLLSCLPCDRPQSKQRCTDCMEKAVPQTVQLHAGAAEGALQSS